MRAALAYEWTRLRTLRSTWWLSGLAVVIGVGVAALLSWALHHEFSTHGSVDLDGIGAAVATQLTATGAVPSVVCFLLAVVGIFAWGHEYRHGMIRASLTALPSRAAFWWAKVIVVGAWVAVVVAVTTLLSALVGLLVLHQYVTVLTGTTWRVIGCQVLYGVLLTWLAMAFTAVTRSQAFALTALFLWPLLIESLVFVFFEIVPQLRDDTGLLRFLPFRAGRSMTDVIDSSHGVFGDPLSPLGGSLIFGGTAAVLLVVSLVLFRRRDA